MKLFRPLTLCAMACLGSLLFAASPAAADTVVVNHVYDPSNVVLGSIAGEPLITPVTLGVGDTLDLTITFTGGQIAHFDGEDGLWLLLLTNGGDATLETTGTLEFLGASSNVVSGPIPLDQDNSFIHVGSYYFNSLYRLDADPISFSGLRQIITITADDIGTDREYQTIALAFFAGSVRFSGSVVPEPASAVLMISAVGLVAASKLRRRRPR
jgi:hypothetical protein